MATSSTISQAWMTCFIIKEVNITHTYDIGSYQITKESIITGTLKLHIQYKWDLKHELDRGKHQLKFHWSESLFKKGYIKPKSAANLKGKVVWISPIKIIVSRSNQTGNKVWSTTYHVEQSKIYQHPSKGLSIRGVVFTMC